MPTMLLFLPGKKKISYKQLIASCVVLRPCGCELAWVQNKFVSPRQELLSLSPFSFSPFHGK